MNEENRVVFSTISVITNAVTKENPWRRRFDHMACFASDVLEIENWCCQNRIDHPFSFAVDYDFVSELPDFEKDLFSSRLDDIYEFNKNPNVRATCSLVILFTNLSDAIYFKLSHTPRDKSLTDLI